MNQELIKMDKKSINSIGIIGHVNHGKTVLTAAVSSALSYKGLAETPGTPIGSIPRESLPFSKNPMSQKDAQRIADSKEAQHESDREEYVLILQKKSKLSASKRAAIVKLFE